MKEASEIETEKTAQVQPSFMPLAKFENLWCSTVMSVDELRANPRRVVVDILRLFLANKTPITLWGPVGARKTRTIQSLLQEVDENGTHYQVLTIQPSTEDPTVIHGMMFTSLDANNGETIMKRSLPAIVDQIIKYWEEHRGLTILFLDEMTTCLPAQQHALLGLMTHGHYGDKNIQPYISIAMAANPEGTVSTVNELGEQVINRGGHVAWYGDVDLFLEEWSSGFNNPKNAPSATAKWYVSEMLTHSSKEAFRNDRWDVKSLVPYDLIEHTERSVTEFGKMVELIDKVFASAQPAVRKFYIIESARALLGNEWADKVSKIAETESKVISPEKIAARARELGLNLATPASDEATTEFAREFVLTPTGGPVDTAKAEVMMSDIMSLIDKRGFSLDAYIAAWAFATLSGNDGFAMGLHRSLVRLATHYAPIGMRSEVLKRGTTVVPTFVGDEVRKRLKASLDELRKAASDAAR